MRIFALVLIVGISPAIAGEMAWKDTGIMADFSGHDLACSHGPVPALAMCNQATKGIIAVCWRYRQTGECGNAVSWCTYKGVSLASLPNGAAPGDIYACDEK